MAEKPPLDISNEALLFVAGARVAIPGQVLAAGEPHSRIVTIAGSAVSGHAGQFPGSTAGAIRRMVRRAAGSAMLSNALAFEWDRGTAFLFMPVLMAGGAFAYFALETEPATVSLFLPLALLAGLAWLLRARLVPLLVVISAFLFVAGMMCAKVETLRAGTRMLGSEISTVITGKVIALEHQASGRVRLTVEVLGTARPELRYAPEKVRVSARSVPAGLQAGSDLSGTVRLFPPSGPLRPDGYDFSFESYFDGIGANGFFLREPQLATAAAEASPSVRFFAWVENARTALAERIRARIGGAEGEIAAALVAGVRAGIPEDVNEALRRTGLAHVLSISGLHMALVAATIMASLRLCFALFPEFASRRPVKKYAAVAALLATAAYLFISGSAVAAERSFVMLAVMLIALLFDRAALTMRNLAIAAVIVVLFSPHEVAGPSFQMSFAATAALIGGYAAWTDRRAEAAGSRSAQASGWAWRTARKFAGYAVALALTSLVAGLATTIYGVWHFHRVSPLSLFANLAAMPIVSVLVMPFAVLAAVTMPFGLDGPFLDVMGFGLRLMIAVATWFSDRSPFDAVGAIPGTSVVLMTVALILATVMSSWLRIVAIPFLVAGLFLLVDRQLADVVIDEDASIVAVRLEDDGLAVSRARGSAFALATWQRSMATDHTVKPVPARAGSRQNAAAGFACGDGLCLARHPSGAVIAHAEGPDAAFRACGVATVLVIDDATVEKPCGDRVLTIGKRELARRGAAEITLALTSGAPTVARVSFALPKLHRPWHDHRAFSRAARGMLPFQSKRDQRQSRPAHQQQVDG